MHDIMERVESSSCFFFKGESGRNQDNLLLNCMHISYLYNSLSFLQAEYILKAKVYSIKKVTFNYYTHILFDVTVKHITVPFKLFIIITTL